MVFPHLVTMVAYLSMKEGLLKVNLPNNTKYDLYFSIFGILQVIDPGQFTLTMSERKLISKLYAKRDELMLSGFDDTDANVIVFSAVTREALMSELELGYNSYNNLISSLRKKVGLILGQKLHPFFDAIRETEIEKEEFTFTLKFTNELEES